MGVWELSGRLSAQRSSLACTVGTGGWESGWKVTQSPGKLSWEQALRSRLCERRSGLRRAAREVLSGPAT